jgi:hypothetical protein
LKPPRYAVLNVESKAAACWNRLSDILDCGVRFVKVIPLFQVTEYAVVDTTVAFWIWGVPLAAIGVLGCVGVEPGLNTPWSTNGPAPPGSYEIM